MSGVQSVTATINSNASGVWSKREGESVEVVDQKPNGMATGVLRKGAKKVAYLPTRWLDVHESERDAKTQLATEVIEPLIEHCPTCGQPIADSTESQEP